MSDERLGSWVVLRRLADDLLGPTWRLGRADLKGGVEGLALARTFTGAGLAAEGRNLANVVDHPFVATTTDLFEHQGQCIVAWQYTSGHSLREILERASDRMMPLNPGLCLLIGERVAQGLAAASQRQLDGAPLHHGLLRPELVWITNDGEVKVLGFEVGRALAGRLAAAPAFGPFLAPEVRAGNPVEARDDVYSLAAVLYAAITGDDPPSHDADRAAAQATSAEDGGPLAPELTRLLVSCLGPRGGRPATAEALHDALREISLAAPRRVGPFELAYAVHGLFGDEIANEAKELEQGGRPAATGGRESSRPTSATAAQPLPTQPVVMASFADEPGAEGAASRRAPWLPIAAGLAVVAVGAALMLSRGQDAPQVALAAAPQPAPVLAPATPAGPTPEELQAQIRALVEQRTGAVAAELRDQQEAEIKALQEQLAAAQAATVAATESTATAPAPTPAAATPGTTVAPGPATSPATAATQPPTSAQPTPAPPAAPTSAAPSSPGSTSTAPPGTANPGTASSNTAPPGSAAASTASPTTPPQSTPRPEPTTPPRAAAPSPSQSNATASIATPGPGVNPPTMLTFAKPEYPLLARRTKVQGTVILSILVDEQGRATDIKFLKRVEQDVGLNEAAEKAARASTWRPATKDGKPVKMWFTLPVPFALE